MSFKDTLIGKIPSDWLILSVGELVNEGVLCKPMDGNHGGIHPKGSDFVATGIPFVMASDINNGSLSFENCKFITELQANQLRKGFAVEGDVLITHKATIGRVALVRKNPYNFIILTPQVTYYRVANNKKLNNKFLKYYFEYNNFKNLLYLWSGAGSTRSYIGITQQLKLPIVVPPIEDQHFISNIIYSIDEKIELNNDINKNLEEMAQTLFKRWFVDFEFTNENGEPYKSNGGEFEESELGLIPKGWSFKAIYDLANYINGTSFKANEISEIGIPIIKIAELKSGITPQTRYFQAHGKDDKYYIENEDILFSWSGNPETSIDTFIWSKGKGILNQHIFKVVPSNKDYKGYIYTLLKYMKSTFTRIASGKQTTGLGHVTIKDLKRLMIAFPNEETLKDFARIINPIIKQIYNNNLENELLNHSRDTLLPKLMSGELRVSLKPEYSQNLDIPMAVESKAQYSTT